MLPHDALVAGVEADALSAEGLFHVDGIYYATFGDAALVRHRLAERAVGRALLTRSWARRGAMVDGVAIRPVLESRPTLFERCTWCAKRFVPGEAVLSLAGRHMHDTACRQEFDRFISEAEIARAQATLELVEA